MLSLTNEIKAKCLSKKKKKNVFRFVFLVLRIFFGDDFHIMNSTEWLKTCFDFCTRCLKWISKSEEEKKDKPTRIFTSRGKFFINKRFAINWLCRGIFESGNLLIKFRCSWLGIFVPVEWLISIDWARWEQAQIDRVKRKRRRRRENQLKRFDLKSDDLWSTVIVVVISFRRPWRISRFFSILFLIHSSL